MVQDLSQNYFEAVANLFHRAFFCSDIPTSRAMSKSDVAEIGCFQLQDIQPGHCKY